MSGLDNEAEIRVLAVLVYVWHVAASISRTFTISALYAPSVIYILIELCDCGVDCCARRTSSSFAANHHAEHATATLYTYQRAGTG